MVDIEQNILAQVVTLVEKLARRQLDPVQVVSVQVTEDHDPDGDPVLHVIVVYEADDIELDASKLSGFVRHLRPALSESGEDRFPVMSFIAEKEHAGAT